MKPLVLKGKDTLDESSNLIYGAHGQEEKFWELVIKHLEDVEVRGDAYGIRWSYNIACHQVSLMGSKPQGETRKFLIVESLANPFKVLVGARTLGKYLAVTKIIWMEKLDQDGDERFIRNYFSSSTGDLINSIISIAVQDALTDLIEGIGSETKEIKEVLKAW